MCSAEYAQVLRMLGNGRLEAMCIDGIKRLCHIRGKMRKKVWVNTVRRRQGVMQISILRVDVCSLHYRCLALALPVRPPSPVQPGSD